MRRPPAPLVWLALTAFPAAGRAQEPAQEARDSARAAPGACVRLRYAGGDAWRTGRLAAATRDSVVLRPCVGCARATFARAGVVGVEVRRGLPGSRSRHALVGAGAGALLAAAATSLSVQRRCARDPGGDGPPCELGYVAVPLTAFAGLFGGALVGFALPGERWRPAVVGAPAP